MSRASGSLGPLIWNFHYPCLFPKVQGQRVQRHPGEFVGAGVKNPLPLKRENCSIFSPSTRFVGLCFNKGSILTALCGYTGAGSHLGSVVQFKVLHFSSQCADLQPKVILWLEEVTHM